jgi:hypothetical protein
MLLVQPQTVEGVEEQLFASSVDYRLLSPRRLTRMTCSDVEMASDLVTQTRAQEDPAER